MKLKQARAVRNKRPDNFPSEEKNILTTLINYNDTVNLVIQSKKWDIIPACTGQDMTSRNPYKINSDSMFGNLFLDPNKLNDFKVEAYQDGKKVLSRKADRDMIDLLTKR